ncbi:MAG: hypothetical protein ACRC5R_02910, partial [Mycoplasmatales bacterium]
MMKIGVNYNHPCCFIFLIANEFKLFEKHDLDVLINFTDDFKLGANDVSFDQIKNIFYLINKNKQISMGNILLSSEVNFFNTKNFLFEPNKKNYNNEYDIKNTKKESIDEKSDDIFNEILRPNVYKKIQLEEMYCLLFAKEFANKEKEQIKKLTFALNESVRILNALYPLDKDIILNDILLTDEKLIKLY